MGFDSGYPGQPQQQWPQQQQPQWQPPGQPQWQPPQPGQWQPPQPQQPPLPGKPRPRRRPPRKRSGARLIFGALCGLAIIIFIAISASHGSTSSPSVPATGGAPATGAPAAPATGAPATTTAAQRAAAAPRTVAKFSGSGQENTPSFTVSATWKLSYSYNCSAFGGSGNFIVFEDGGKDLNGVTVNQLGAGKSGTSWAYGDAGSHYLEVDSECDWSMTVTDEG